jgi:hypothetical protein
MTCPPKADRNRGAAACTGRMQFDAQRRTIGRTAAGPDLAVIGWQGPGRRVVGGPAASGQRQGGQHQAG